MLPTRCTIYQDPLYTDRLRSYTLASAAPWNGPSCETNNTLSLLVLRMRIVDKLIQMIQVVYRERALHTSARKSHIQLCSSSAINVFETYLDAMLCA